MNIDDLINASMTDAEKHNVDEDFFKFLSSLSKLTDVELDDVINIMHESGFDEAYCTQYVANPEKVDQKKLKEQADVFKTKFRNLLNINSSLAAVKAI